MKKILLGLLMIFGMVLMAQNALATTTEIQIPELASLTSDAFDTVGTFLTGFWPILGLLLGILFFRWILSKLGG